MGNEQSQESSAQPKEEDPEQTDLSDIPDDREPDPASDEDETIMPVGAGNAKPPIRKPRKQKKKKKRTGRWSSEDGEARRLSQHVPDEEEIQLLREREPEAFDVYASSQDGDDDDDSRALVADVNSRDTTSADTEGEAEGVAGNKHDEVNQSLLDNKPLPAANAIPSSSVADQEVSPIQPIQVHVDLVPATQAVPEPLKVNDRWLCPYAETYHCESTFPNKKTAKRHGAVHVPAFTCTVCGKKLSRKGILQRHIASHSQNEVISADAQQRANQSPIAHTATSLQTSVIESNLEEPQDEKSPEYKTPRESSQDQLESDDNVAEEGNAQINDEHEVESAHDMIRAVERSLQAQLDAQSIATQEDEEDDAGSGEDPVEPEADSKSQPSVAPSVSDVAEEPSSDGTPVPELGLKRKRDADAPSDSPDRPKEKKLKRRKQAHNTPPTSAQRTHKAMPRAWAAVNSTSESTLQTTERIVPTLRTRQSTIDSWAQRSNAGSGSRPSISASGSPPPSTARPVEVVLPSGSSKAHSKGKADKSNQPNGTSQTNGLESFGIKRTRDAAYTTPKGKNRAEPGLNYVSPGKQRAEAGESDSEPTNFATSVAKKTLSGSRPRKRARSQHEDSSSETGGLHVGDAAANGMKKTLTKQTRPKANNVVECQKCHKGFKSEASLKLHLKDPNIHSHLHSCGECTEQFWSMSLLSKHEKETGHDRGNGVQGLTGHFTEAEVQKLQDWRDTFCADHNISVEQFNDMMTDTLKRRKGESWDWHFISKRAFLNEYYEVLPYRNRRSMTRYRERNFQNLEGSKNWTAEDDRDLIRLHKELGPKWSEIAQRLMRTTDAVAQRWRHKLQHKHNESGKWTADEEDRFAEALEEVRRTTGLASQAEDWHIPWNKVSEKVETRSALQCSNHYRVLHSTKRQGRWIKIGGLEKTPGSSRILTPSKMERRLRRQTGGSAKRSRLSRDTVAEDDDEEEVNERNDRTPSPPIDEEEEEDVSAAEDDDQSSVGSSSHQERNPLQAQTPNETLRPTQIFGQTQANTSVVRPLFPESRRQLPSQDAPSPNIPIQRQKLSVRSPLSEIMVKEDDDDSDDGGEAEDNESEPTSDLSKNGEEEEDVDSEQRLDPPYANGADDDEEDDEAEDRENENSDEDQDPQDEENDGNDFMNSIEQSAQRVRSNQKLKLQPATTNGFQNGLPSRRRNRWSMSSDESDS
ncbi:hypothetical protein RBB50_006978 [Rhinocladiella similis]